MAKNNQIETQKNRGIVKDLDMCDELLNHFYEVISKDDGIEVWEYSDEEIIMEAEYVKSRYEDQTWSWGYALAGHEGRESQKMAQKEYKEINKYLKKWGKK